MKRRVFQVEEVDEGRALGEVLAQRLVAPQSETEALVRAGSVYVAGRRCLDAGRRLRTGESVTAVLSRTSLTDDEQQAKIAAVLGDSSNATVATDSIRTDGNLPNTSASAVTGGSGEL